jgi:S-adenosylmethionine synthetase
VSTLLVGQDVFLSENQRNGLRCGDNGIFRGRMVTYEQALLSEFSNRMSERFGSDGKYIINGDELIICQSRADLADIIETVKTFEREKGVKFRHTTINPLGYWDGGTDVDSGATNRKLGSDMGNSVAGGGLHGKDLSKADVSVNIFCHLLAEQYKCDVEACCAIGDVGVTFILDDEKEKNVTYDEIVKQARTFLSEHYDGSFEKFAETGLI